MTPADLPAPAGRDPRALQAPVREEIEAYLASGEWRGKAGGYAAQGIAGTFMVKLVGSYTGIVGLPLYETVALLGRRRLPDPLRLAEPVPTPRTHGRAPRPAYILAHARKAQAATPARSAASPPTGVSLPFCSPRCADVDLNRWLSGVYAIPVTEDEEEDERARRKGRLSAY